MPSVHQLSPRPCKRSVNLKWLWLSFVALAAATGSPPVALAQASTKTNVEDKTVVTGDNVELKLTYYKSNSGKDAPVAILLHGKKGSRQPWKTLAHDLQTKKDFAVVAVDLRGHGDSVQKRSELKKADYLAMVSMDMEAIRDFLLEEHQKGQLNINKQGIVACDFSASVALAYTEIDWGRAPYDDSPTPELRTPRGQDVRALALISPDISTPGLMANKAAPALRAFPIAVLICHSQKNAQDSSASRKLYEQFTVSAKKEKLETYYREEYPEDVRGMDLVLRDSQIRGHIVNFLDLHVKKVPSEWRERRSRLERE